MSTGAEQDREAAAFLVAETMGYLPAAALRAAAVLGVADLLADGPRTPAELAEQTGTDAVSLHRVLRLLATRGIFREDPEGRFCLTDRANPLRTTVSGSVRDAVLMSTSDLHWRSAGELATAVRTGKPAFESVFGMPYFGHLAGDETAARVFHQGMASLSAWDNPFTVESYRFPESGLLVDLGGGQGGLLLTVLSRNPGLRGVLFDREEALAGHRLASLGEPDRWTLAPGDFFESVPSGGDLYTLQNVLHDWDDEQCVRILGNVRRAMAPDARLLVIDAVIPPGNDPSIAKTLDVLMVGVLPGRVRTEAEFAGLFAEAGLRLAGVLPTPGHLSILEVTRPGPEQGTFTAEKRE
jgi:hypothetical protein